MTILIVIVIVAILVVLGILMIKRTAQNKIGGTAPKTSVVNLPGNTPPSVNPGSIPDKAGTKGDGNSALSSGGQG